MGETRTAPRWLLPLAIVIVTFAAYAPTLRFDFVYDDYAQVVETRQLNSWHMIPRYFTGHVWAWKTPRLPGPYYRPVFLLWLLANHMLFGLAASWWHFTSVLAHIGATLLVYALAGRITSDRWAGGFAALLFGLHPAHVESVAWVSGIPDPLATVFLLGAFLTFLNGGKYGGWISLGLYGSALLVKEVTIVFPVLIFAYVWRFEMAPPNYGVRLRAAASAVMPYVYVTLIYIGVRLAVLHEFSMVITPVPLLDMALTWPSMLVFYFRHLVWPVSLSVFYSVPVIHSPDLRSFALPCVIVAAVVAGLAVWSVRSRGASFSALLMIVPLLPAMNLRSFARGEIVHDRYLYLPSVGFCILAGIVLRRLRLGGLSAARPLLPQVAIATVVGGALGYGAVHESQYWMDNLTLFHRAAAISPNNEIANQCLGTAFLLRNQMAEAIPYYQHALELNPNMPEALYDLGRCYYELGMYAECERYFERSAAAAPTHAEAYLYYGLAKLQQQQLDLAENVIRRAIRIKGPDDYREYRLSLGLVLEQKGDLQGALQEFEAEAHENPDPSRALEHIADVKSKLAGRQ